jgi:hypothetical protein
LRGCDSAFASPSALIAYFTPVAFVAVPELAEELADVDLGKSGNSLAMAIAS